MESVMSVLSVFLMGLLPVLPSSLPAQVTPQSLPLAPPAVASAKTFPAQKLGRTLSASGVAILDLASGQEIFARAPNQRRPVGSLTKIMTAILIVESHEMDEDVTIPADIASTVGSVVHLRSGDHLTVGDLLSALLIPSANDAAETLAKFHAGTRGKFVMQMNERAKMLGLNNTSFANPSGLDDKDQWSSARDMAWLAAYALKFPEIRTRMSTVTMTITSREGHTYALENTNELLGEDPDVLAGKTGTTNAAKQCLLSIITHNGREYLVVLLRSRERYGDMRAVLRVLRSLLV